MKYHVKVSINKGEWKWDVRSFIKLMELSETDECGVNDCASNVFF